MFSSIVVEGSYLDQDPMDRVGKSDEEIDKLNTLFFQHLNNVLARITNDPTISFNPETAKISFESEEEDGGPKNFWEVPDKYLTANRCFTDKWDWVDWEKIYQEVKNTFKENGWMMFFVDCEIPRKTKEFSNNKQKENY